MYVLPSYTDKLNQWNKAEETHPAQLQRLHFWSLLNFFSQLKQILATFLVANLKQVWKEQDQSPYSKDSRE